jgi:hypothetical protein
MSKYNIPAIAFILVYGLLTGYSCLAGRVPSILFDGEKYKFGEVPAGTEVVFTFSFKNTGTSDLLLTNLYISCECVVIKDYTRRVKPGARGQIYGLVKTQGFLGEMVRAIRVETNIPRSEPAMLILEGKILPPPASSAKS